MTAIDARACRGAHPRSRGENLQRLVIISMQAGSSPLTRGKRAQAVRKVLTRGLIPAHAGKTTSVLSSGGTTRAHPRSRGENASASLSKPSTSGSSPLTRGKPRPRRRRRSRQRLIPAHAGKTTTLLGTLAASRAHPRSRGENEVKSAQAHYRRGSSPLTRGKHGGGRGLSRLVGLIPAHAGKTRTDRTAIPTGWAHPRSRGENASADAPEPPTRGSSPLRRGKRNRRRHGQGGHGLIPAHAGKTSTPSRTCANLAAHPRSRGENMMCAIVGFPVPGSSPLTRGKHRRPLRCRPAIRLIPAHAGKTVQGRGLRRGPRAHPRSRGENRVLYGSLSDVQGSSPLTRGKPNAPSFPHSRNRLIPAHAGKTKASWPWRASRRAHPRSRGENRLEELSYMAGPGSSPLTRGKRPQRDGEAPRGGLIPAHAGKTYVVDEIIVSEGAHPRSRGENDSNDSFMPPIAGSSPLTRGKRDQLAGRGYRRGLIPAHAGKTCLRAGRCLSRRAHPRSRGENP